MIQHIRADSGISKRKDAPTIMYEDNAACIAQLKDGYIKGDMTKHILPKFFFTHGLQKNGELQVLQTERYSVRYTSGGVIRVVLFFLIHGFVPLGFTEKVLMR
ncbi:hypothetical protein Bca101_068422 [Brassica carinata]